MTELPEQAQIAERTNALGLFHYAYSYALSAIALEGIVNSPHSDAPIRYLFAHACELYLKAFLLLHGETAKTLRDRYGHSFKKLVAAALDHGLSLDPKEVRMIHAFEASILDRYLETGTRRVLSDAQMAALCRNLNAQIGPAVYKSRALRRAAPAL